MRCPDCKHDNIQGAEICANCGRDLQGLDIPGAMLDPGVDFVTEALSEIPTRPLYKVQASDPAGMAIRYMQHENADCVLVLNGGELAGIVTLWDVLHRVAGAGKDLNAMSCAEIMTADPVYLREDDTIAVAINKMSVGGFRHIPLLEGETPVRVISLSDVFQRLSPNLM